MDCVFYKEWSDTYLWEIYDGHHQSKKYSRDPLLILQENLYGKMKSEHQDKLW